VHIGNTFQFIYYYQYFENIKIQYKLRKIFANGITIKPHIHSANFNLVLT